MTSRRLPWRSRVCPRSADRIRPVGVAAGRLPASLVRVALAALLLSFGPGPGLGSGHAVAAERPAATGTGPSARCESALALAAQVRELTRRIGGMEGKLKDSAAARKAADQARMQAERRLAAGLQTLERAEAQLRASREARAALEQRVKRLEEQGERTGAALAESERVQRRLVAERDAQQRRSVALEGQLGELAAERRRTGQAQAAPVEGADQAATEAQSRAAAAAAAAALRTAQERSPGVRNAPTPQALREIEQTLYRHQSAIARAAGARGVYRVRPGDTLASIAARQYADHSRWPAIYEANRHVLPDPDRLVAGMTLIVP
jgi:nucleoid-associated protein YgaU